LKTFWLDIKHIYQFIQSLGNIFSRCGDKSSALINSALACSFEFTDWPQGIEPSPGTRASFTKFLAEEKARLEPIVKRANMKED